MTDLPVWRRQSEVEFEIRRYRYATDVALEAARLWQQRARTAEAELAECRKGVRP